MDEPTVAVELQLLRQDVQRLIAAQEQYVTKEILELKLAGAARDLAAVARDQADDRARLANITRWFWTALVGPVIVGIVLYALIGGKP